MADREFAAQTFEDDQVARGVGGGQLDCARLTLGSLVGHDAETLTAQTFDGVA